MHSHNPGNPQIVKEKEELLKNPQILALLKGSESLSSKEISDRIRQLQSILLSLNFSELTNAEKQQCITEFQDDFENRIIELFVKHWEAKAKQMASQLPDGEQQLADLGEFKFALRRFAEGFLTEKFTLDMELTFLSIYNKTILDLKILKYLTPLIDELIAKGWSLQSEKAYKEKAISNLPSELLVIADKNPKEIISTAFYKLILAKAFKLTAEEKNIQVDACVSDPQTFRAKAMSFQLAHSKRFGCDSLRITLDKIVYTRIIEASIESLLNTFGFLNRTGKSLEKDTVTATSTYSVQNENGDSATIDKKIFDEILAKLPWQIQVIVNARTSAGATVQFLSNFKPGVEPEPAAAAAAAARRF